MFNHIYLYHLNCLNLMYVNLLCYVMFLLFLLTYLNWTWNLCFYDANSKMFKALKNNLLTSLTYIYQGKLKEMSYSLIVFNTLENEKIIFLMLMFNESFYTWKCIIYIKLIYIASVSGWWKNTLQKN